MTKTELAERIRNGEDSKVEFKRDDVANYGLLPAPGAGFDALDWRRLHEYLTRVLAGDAPHLEDRQGWETHRFTVRLLKTAEDRAAKQPPSAGNGSHG